MNFNPAPNRQESMGRLPRSILFYVMAFLVLALAAAMAVYSTGRARAWMQPVSATQAAEESSLVPAESPGDINIDKHLLLYLGLAQRALRDVQVDDKIRRQANDAVETQKDEIRFMIGELEAGRPLPGRLVQSLPAKLANLHLRLGEILGHDAALALRLKLQSFRSEGRDKLAELRGMLDELPLDGTRRQQCNSILADTEKKVETLPYDGATYEEMANSHDMIARIFADAHDRLAKVLSSDNRN